MIINFKLVLISIITIQISVVISMLIIVLPLIIWSLSWTIVVLLWYCYFFFHYIVFNISITFNLSVYLFWITSHLFELYSDHNFTFYLLWHQFHHFADTRKHACTIMISSYQAYAQLIRDLCSFRIIIILPAYNFSIYLGIDQPKIYHLIIRFRTAGEENNRFLERSHAASIERW